MIVTHKETALVLQVEVCGETIGRNLVHDFLLQFLIEYASSLTREILGVK